MTFRSCSSDLQRHALAAVLADETEHLRKALDVIDLPQCVQVASQDSIAMIACCTSSGGISGLTLIAAILGLVAHDDVKAAEAIHAEVGGGG